MRNETWWRCGDQSVLSCGQSPMVMQPTNQQSDVRSPPAAVPYSLKSLGPPPSSYSIQKGMRSIMQGIVSPIMSCVAPSMTVCTNDQQDELRQSSDFYVYMPQSGEQASQSSHKVVLSSSSLPLTDIETCHVHCNDILCGRGIQSLKRSNNATHVGNRNFRDLVAANRNTYSRLSNKQKLALARSIVNMVHSTRPAGRFLMRDSTTGLWDDIGMTKSLEKTLQALQELETAYSEVGSSAPTVVSESLASVSTTPASNNSQQSASAQQIIVPPHLQHVFRTTPRPIPSSISPRPPLTQSNVSPYHHHTMAKHVVTPTLYPRSPMPPESPYDMMQYPLPYPLTPAQAASQLQPTNHPQTCMDPEPFLPGLAPSTPPAIWRIHNSSVRLSDIVSSNSTR
jgi:hypothetical protein